MNPYIVLGISEEADSATIRKAYLSLIKKYSPDRDPKRFQLISDSFNKIDTKIKRTNYRFFDETSHNKYTSPFEVLELSTRMPHTRKPLSKNKFKEFLIKCATT